MPPSADGYTAYQSRPPEDEGPSVVGYASLPLAWLVPGLGHIVFGERVRGIIFLVTIHSLFGLGLLFGGMRSIKPAEQPIWTYTQYLNGWPMLVANHFWAEFARDYLPAPNGGGKSVMERDEFEKMGVPPRPDINGEPKDRIKYTQEFIAKYPAFAFHPKVHDMGAVYCGIAGMLNLLVMFDLLLRVTGSVREDPAVARRKRRKEQIEATKAQTGTTPSPAPPAAEISGGAAT